MPCRRHTDAYFYPWQSHSIKHEHRKLHDNANFEWWIVFSTSTSLYLLSSCAAMGMLKLIAHCSVKCILHIRRVFGDESNVERDVCGSVNASSGGGGGATEYYISPICWDQVKYTINFDNGSPCKYVKINFEWVSSSFSGRQEMRCSSNSHV